MRTPTVTGEVAPTPPTGEIRSLTGLRIVAAAWVVCYHFSAAPGDSWSRYWEPVRPLVRSGTLGVDLFFVLSGFVITLTYLDELGRRPAVGAVARFWWARFCRIWPLHAVITTLFGCWLLYKATRVTDGNLAYQEVQPVVDPLHWLEQMLMVQLWHRPGHAGASWSGPAWSISAEWLAYLCFPLVGLLLWRLRGASPLVTGTLAVGCMVPLAWFALTQGGAHFPFSWALRIGGGFLAGAFTCLAVRRIPRTEHTDRVATWLVVLSTVEVLLCAWWGIARGGPGHAAVGGLAFPVLVGALALSGGRISRALSTGPMVLGGRISFALYLVHIPVFEVFYTLMDWYPLLHPNGTVASFLMPHVLLLTLPLAHLLHRSVEEPSRRRLRSLAGPRRRPAPVPVPRHEAAGATLRTLPAVDGPRRPAVPGAPATVDGGVRPVVPVVRTRARVPSGAAGRRPAG
ncbi:acyltransferase family protein [Geodermatophilus sp. URMC 60]